MPRPVGWGETLRLLEGRLGEQVEQNLRLKEVMVQLGEEVKDWKEENMRLREGSVELKEENIQVKEENMELKWKLKDLEKENIMLKMRFQSGNVATDEEVVKDKEEYLVLSKYEDSPPMGVDVKVEKGEENRNNQLPSIPEEVKVKQERLEEDQLEKWGQPGDSWGPVSSAGKSAIAHPLVFSPISALNPLASAAAARLALASLDTYLYSSLAPSTPKRNRSHESEKTF